jgi:cellulose synthase (UDP-forming)
MSLTSDRPQEAPEHSPPVVPAPRSRHGQHDDDLQDRAGCVPAAVLINANPVRSFRFSDNRVAPSPRHAAPGGLIPADAVPPIDESIGQVVARTDAGPRFSRSRVRMATTRRETFVHLLSVRDRLLVAVLTTGWLVAQVSFWLWWLQPERVITWAGMVINTVLLVYLAVLPGYFLIVVNRLRGPREDLPVPDLRVAFVVTKAPSEPWPVARQTLEAMLAQDYPHGYHVWLCDEDPSEETLTWCEEHCVRVSTRHGVEAYHRPAWPRRTKCKEGNLAWFYDQWGYRDYDVVAQLDCDHVPAPTYLAEMVRPFDDPAVGYVAAPSMNDRNAATSWAARGRLHREATFHGPSQTGHQAGLAPSCIGSHYAVRTVALRDAGGVGPELAEDFSTSFLLTSAGWQGAFAHRAEAHGEGPHTLSALLVQEFQWSRSLTVLFIGLVPAHLRRLPWKLRLRFLFALTYYPLIVLTTGVGLLLPPIAAVTGVPWVDVNYVSFLLHWLAIPVWVLLIALLLRRRGLLRPERSPMLSWENWLYVLARWPYIARGVVAAVVQHVRRRPITFRVTPKAPGGLEPLALGVLAPYLVITVGLSTAALVGEARTSTVGYVFLCLVGSVSYAAVSIALPLLHAREAAREVGASALAALRETVAVPVALALAALVPLVTAIALYPAYFSDAFTR